MLNETWKCPKCGIENDIENAFCGECGSKKPEMEIGMAGKAVPKQKEFYVQPDDGEEQQRTEQEIQKPKKKFKPLQFVGGLILVFVGFCLLFGIPMYNDYRKKSRTAEVAMNLKELVKMQILSREDPRVEHFGSDFYDLGFKTATGKFANTPQDCGFSSTSDWHQKYACGKFYAFATGAPQNIVCNENGTGNFATAIAIDRSAVPEDWRCACMDLDFNFKHGNCY